MKENVCHRRGGFTLVEMLVVIAVIAIVVAIVLGVANIVVRRASEEQTRVNMQVVHLAIEAFKRARGDYPEEADENYIGTAPHDWTGVSGYCVRDWEGYMRAKKLYEQIITVPEAQAKVAALSEGGIIYILFTDWHNDPNENCSNIFADGFEKYMEYYKTAGVGGTPVLISSGSDSDFDTEEDNVRSDGR